MKANPPAAADAPVLEELRSLVLVAGKVSIPQARQRFGQAHPQFPLIASCCNSGRKATRDLNGWLYEPKAGIYGTISHRALVTAIGLGANPNQDAIIPRR